MAKLSELRKQLSDEWKKPKTSRNTALIEDLHNQINAQKSLLQEDFKKNKEEHHKKEVETNLSFWRKRNNIYTEIREEKKRSKIEHEKRQQEKVTKSKKSK